MLCVDRIDKIPYGEQSTGGRVTTYTYERDMMWLFIQRARVRRASSRRRSASEAKARAERRKMLNSAHQGEARCWFLWRWLKASNMDWSGSRVSWARLHAEAGKVRGSRCGLGFMVGRTGALSKATGRAPAAEAIVGGLSSDCNRRERVCVGRGKENG